MVLPLKDTKYEAHLYIVRPPMEWLTCKIMEFVPRTGEVQRISESNNTTYGRKHILISFYTYDVVPNIRKFQTTFRKFYGRHTDLHNFDTYVSHNYVEWFVH